MSASPPKRSHCLHARAHLQTQPGATSTPLHVLYSICIHCHSCFASPCQAVPIKCTLVVVGASLVPYRKASPSPQVAKIIDSWRLMQATLGPLRYCTPPCRPIIGHAGLLPPSFYLAAVAAVPLVETSCTCFVSVSV